MRAGLDSITKRAFAMMQAGMQPGPEGSLQKLVAVRSRQKLSELAMDLQGNAANRHCNVVKEYSDRPAFSC